MSKMKKTRKPGGGRKKLKPEYDAGKNLKEQMDAAVTLYNSEMSLQAIADVLNLNPIKVRKLLITAGVYESNAAKKVKNTFEEYRKTQDYKTAILSTAAVLKLSKASVTSYLPYKKGVYFPNTADKEKISVGAERQRRYRAMKRWRADPTEENFWDVVLAYAGVKFKTYSGLPFSYEIKKGRNGEYTKELWIDRRENSKSLAWSSVLLALGHIKKVGEIVERPKALGDIRGVTYIYGMFYRFGLINVPDEAKEKISVGAERQRRYRAMKLWRAHPTEENLWGVVLAYAGIKFKTYSGLPFSYEIKKGRNGEYTKELWIDRREKSKSLAWSSIVLALGNIKEEVVERPKALGNIRGVTYIYGMFYRFGLIDVPDEVKEKMGHPKTRKK